jgi:hypothetical protein
LCQGNNEQTFSGSFGQADYIQEYNIAAVHGNRVANIHLETEFCFQNDQRAQESVGVSFPTINYEQTVATRSFMSVMEDSDFLQTSVVSTGTLPFSMSSESDPFHSDWPYWEHN